MMTADSREDYEAKQEGATINIDKFSKEVPSRQWPGFRNPRIVRVSRSFGGKDRHSKVCTIRGLRDRRIRLSVPTALQLYDLQDRLGLTQPSKVIDWLLEATKYDIDKLPPLQIPQGFAQFHHQTLLPHHDSIALQSSLGPLYDAHNSIGNLNLMTKPRFWDTDAISRLKGKEDHERGSNSEKGKWIKTSEEGNEYGIVGCRSHSQVSVQKLFPSWAHSSLPGLLNNAMAYNNPYHSEPSSLSLSQFGSNGLLFPSQVDPHHPSSGGTSVQFSSSLPVVPSGSQLLFCPSSATPSFFTPNYNPQNNVATSAESHDPRQLNQIQFLSSSSQVVLPPHDPHISCLHPLNSPLIKPLPSPFSAKLLDSDHNNEESDRS